MSVYRGESELAIGGMPRKLLAALFAGRGARINPDALIDTLWPDDPPASARANLRQYVHDLRKFLGSSERIRSGGGYELILHSDTSDADEFIAKVNSAVEFLAAELYPQAAEEFSHALSLWKRSPSAFPGFTGPLIEAERVRLDELRGQAVVSLCAAERHNGRLADHVATIAAAFQRDLFDEQLCGYLMLALHAAGRRDEALRTYQALKHRLSAELGLSPGPELADIHREILGPREQSRPISGKAAPCLLPPNPRFFVGRASEVENICSYLTRERTSTPVVAIYGPGGVGKTELAVRCAYELRSSYPDGQLFVDARAMDDNHLSADSILDTFLRALHFPGDEIPQDRVARSAVFRSALTDRKILIVLDNVNDEIDLGLLMPSTPSNGVLITSRKPLASMAGQCNIRLECPPRSDALAILELYAGSRSLGDSREFFQNIVEVCGALPLALRIIGTQLALRPHLSLKTLLARLSDETQVLPALSIGSFDVSSALDLSARGLSPSALELFALAGLLDAPSFSLRTAAALLDISVSSAEQIVDELIDAQLLDAATVSGRVSYRFHDLVKLYARQLAADMRPQLRTSAALGRAVSAALAEVEEVQTALSGRDHMSIHSSIPRWRPEPQPDTEVMHPTDWARLELQTTLAFVNHAADLGMYEACWDLAVTTAPLLEVTRDFDVWIDTHRVALSAVRAAGDARGEAALLTELSEMHLERHELKEAYILAREAAILFENTNDSEGIALAHEKLGRWSIATGDLTQARDFLGSAVERFRALGRVGNLALVLRCLAQVEMKEGKYETSEILLCEASEHAEAVGAWRLSGQISYQRGNLSLLQGRPNEAENDFRDVLRLFQNRPEPLGQAYGLLGLGRVASTRGDREGGKRHLYLARQLASEVGDRSLTAEIDNALAEISGPEFRADRCVGDLVFRA